MAATKTSVTLLSAVTTTQTSSAQSTAGDYADTCFISIAQVGTATTAAQLQVQESPDGGTTWYQPSSKLVTAGLAAGTYYAEIPLDPTASGVKVTYTQQAGGTSSTCTVQLGQVTGI